jgi:putative peptidoglycan binding protein
MTPWKIVASVGKAGANKPDDVASVQTLLNQFRTTKLSVTKQCGPETIQAIVDFQKRFMTLADGRVDPNGPTWRKLVAPPPIAGPLMGPFLPLQLKPIQRVSVRLGGYKITYTGPVPSGASVRLLVKEDKFFLDIAGGYGASHLPKLLALFDQLNAANNDQFWGKNVSCWVALFINGVMAGETRSQPRDLPCPVRPVKGLTKIGKIGVFKELGQQQPALLYVKEGPQHGRLLKFIGDKHYVVLGSILETDNDNRGFDCTTFVGSALGRHSGMAGTSDEFAKSLDATPCHLESKPLSDVRTYFKTHSTGAYLLWSADHIVAVVDGFVHEFTTPVGKPGYKNSDVQKWHKDDVRKYTVRQLPPTFL